MAFLSRILQIVYRITHETLILKKRDLLPNGLAGYGVGGLEGPTNGRPERYFRGPSLVHADFTLCYVAFGSGSGAARNIDVFAESVAHCESHGIRDKGTVVEHTYLILS